MFHIQKRRTQYPRLLNINAIDALKGIDDKLAAVGEDGVDGVGGNNLDGHAGLDADAVPLGPLLCCD